MKKPTIKSVTVTERDVQLTIDEDALADFQKRYATQFVFDKNYATRSFHGGIKFCEFRQSHLRNTAEIYVFAYDEHTWQISFTAFVKDKQKDNNNVRISESNRAGEVGTSTKPSDSPKANQQTGGDKRTSGSAKAS